MSSEEPFGPWVEPMERAGARDPRSTDGRLSWGGLARLAGVSTSAITNMVYGRTKRPHPRTVQKVAEALGVSPETVSEWIGLARPVGRPYEPDGSSSLLYEHERAALDELIRAITRGREEKAGGERADRSAPKTPAGDEPASKVHDLNQPDQDRDMDARVAELLAGPHAARRGVPDHADRDETGEESQTEPDEAP